MTTCRHCGKTIAGKRKQQHPPVFCDYQCNADFAAANTEAEIEKRLPESEIYRLAAELRERRKGITVEDEKKPVEIYEVHMMGQRERKAIW